MSEEPASRGTVNVAVINQYDPAPYTFTEAALCLRDSIRAAGYRSEIHVNRADTLQRCIVLGALPPYLWAVQQLDRRKGIIFNFEQLGSASILAGTPYVELLMKFMVADYHERNIEWLRDATQGRQHAFELPIVPSPSIAFRPDLPAEPVVDVLFYGSPSPRRTKLLDDLAAAGLKVEIVAGAFAHELTPAIKRARVVLHAHFYETSLFPVARVLQPVAQRVPVVCEDSVFSRRNDWSASGIVFAPYEGLVDACRSLAASPEEQRARAEASLRFAAGLDFATPFGHMLDALERMPLTRPSPPQPVPAPTAPPNAQPVVARIAEPAPVQHHDAPLSDEEIEAILHREAQELPPEAHLPAAPLKIVERQPGKGPYGVWIVILLLLFSFYTIWQSMQR